MYSVERFFTCVFWFILILIGCSYWNPNSKILFVLICIVFAILVYWGMSMLYASGRKKTFYGIAVLLAVAMAGVFYDVQGARMWEDYQYDHSPERILSKKEQSISDMKYGLQKQLDAIVEIRNKYQNDINGFVYEIQEEKKKYGILSIANATERVLYNIRLIQERDACLTKLAVIEKATKNGMEEAVYILRQIDGAKGMVKIMADGNSLSDNAENILKKYGSFTQPVAIKQSELALKSPMFIWQQYVQWRPFSEAILEEGLKIKERLLR